MSVEFQDGKVWWLYGKKLDFLEVPHLVLYEVS
jgi:hypothetical protein